MSTNLQVRAKRAVDTAEKRIAELENEGRLRTPPDYSAANALRSAYLELQETKDKNKNPVLESCTAPSITNALLSMVSEGLTPAKDQGYFIAYGNQLSWQRSYFGDISLARRMAGVKEVNPQVVYQEDEFKYTILEDGRYKVTKHEQTLESLDSKDWKAAYCVVTFEDDREPVTGIMTKSQVETSWKQGNYNPGSKYEGAHEKFPEEMIKRTVIRRTLKPFVQSSSDNFTMTDSYAADDVNTEQYEEETAQEVFDADYEAEGEEEPQPEQTEQPSPKPPMEKAEPKPEKKPEQPKPRKKGEPTEEDFEAEEFPFDMEDAEDALE